VNPGFGGQSFIPRVLDKVKRLDALRTDRGIPFFIEVDGGVGMKNAADLIRAGADALVAGNAFFNAVEPKAAASALLSEMARGRTA